MQTETILSVGEAWRRAKTPAIAPLNKISVHYRIDGGKLLSAKNAHRIVARCFQPQRGHVGMAEDYKETWVIKKEAKGFCFTEITHGGGICGHAPSVRLLVLRSSFALFGPNTDREIVLVSEEQAAELHRTCDAHKEIRAANEARWWPTRRAA